MKTLTAILLMTLASFSVAASDIDKHEAYILLNKDTVFGHILTNDLSSVSLKIDFESPDGKITTYLPGDIKRFGIYVLDTWRKYVVLDLGEPTGAKVNSSTLVFAQALEETGKVRLYKYECYSEGRPKTINPDISKPGDRILLEETCLIKNDEVLRLTRNSLIGNTKKRLRTFFADCPTVLASLRQTHKLNENMQALVRQYNHCGEKKAPPSRPS